MKVLYEKVNIVFFIVKVDCFVFSEIWKLKEWIWEEIDKFGIYVY